MDCLLRVLLTTIVIARSRYLQSSRSVVRSTLRALHQLSSSFVGGFAGGLPFVGVLFSGFTPCLESADSGITSINWLYSLSGLGISTRITRTPYCAASLGSRGIRAVQFKRSTKCSVTNRERLDVDAFRAVLEKLCLFRFQQRQ